MQRKQKLVKLANQKEGTDFINYLEKTGFNNYHKISYDSLHIKVLAIDNKNFYAINVTCLAALANCKIKPISTTEFISDLENHA